jgi:phosphoglycerol transferase MdoB-like AlkP superfamily enzyme
MSLSIAQLLVVLSVLLPSLIVGLVLSFGIEQIFKPRFQAPWRRPLPAIAAHLGLWLGYFVLGFVLCRRPWLSMLFSTAIFACLIVVNNAKYQSLREFFVYQDNDYFLDCVKHPRLYLPFLGIVPTALTLTAIVVALWAGVTLEAPLTQGESVLAVWLGIFAVLVVACALLHYGSSNVAALNFDPAHDLKTHGFFGAYWLYRRAEQLPSADLAQRSSLPKPSAVKTSRVSPNIVVIQSESFFDPRRVYPQVKPEVLQHFDRARLEADLHGLFEVPAWGANTVRTEFSFLTGVDVLKLGVDRFNPYRRLINFGVPSLARLLQQQGYRTICVHPYPASFYQRDKLFPMLGFDQFVDISEFEAVTEQRKGDCHFVGDEVVADKVLELLGQESEQPTFVFVITMENHGPLHLESLPDQDKQEWLTEPLPEGCEDLGVYLRHIGHADQMIKKLTEGLTSTGRPATLAWYGDHVPIMEKVYQQLATPSGYTDYFIWRTQRAAMGEESRAPLLLQSHLLAAEILKRV